jgi:hypothetical protein
MTPSPAKILQQGCTILDEVLQRHGFRSEEIVSGKGSGGHFATTVYENGDRKLELHFRYSLGLVTYHMGSVSVSHESFMRAVLGSKGGNKYPGFSDAPADSFQDLACDLEEFAQSFLAGDTVEFSKYVAVAQEQSSTGFARLAESES